MKVRIDLTPEQTEKLRPLADKVVLAREEQEPCMIVGRAWMQKESPVISCIDVVFLPEMAAVFLAGAMVETARLCGKSDLFLK